MVSMTTPATRTLAAKTDVRRGVLAVTISSFSIAALMGIAALLGAGDFGETSVRILLTTVVVGCASVVTLCCLVVVGGRFEPAGVLGFLFALATAGLALVMVWGGSDDLIEDLYQVFGVGVTASLTLAQICLLLGLAGARRSLARLMWATVVLAVVVGAMVCAMITGYDPSDSFLRALGIIAILDVLGTLVTISLGVFGRADDRVTVTLPPAVAARVQAESAATGRPVGEVVDEALARYFDVPVD
jgi:hypothetical protein